MENAKKVQNKLRHLYDRAFYTAQIEGSMRSARVVVPLLLELHPGVRSVVDVGCGAGVWLARFKEAGVERVLGLDGGSAEESGQLEIDPEEFRSADFERELSVRERFDLCLCLEVAEHLTYHAGPSLVRNLCALSDVVVFSAAIPGQGGTRHINERWPTYWASLFDAQGYQQFDCIRGRIWNDARIEYWYRQNLVVFANEDGQRRLDQSKKNAVIGGFGMLDVVHPECFHIFRSELENRLTSGTGLIERAALHEQVSSLTARLDEITHSTSWRVTSPLRQAFASHRRIRYFLRRLAHLLARRS